jgi:hypothetical protein
MQHAHNVKYHFACEWRLSEVLDACRVTEIDIEEANWHISGTGHVQLQIEANVGRDEVRL